MAKLSEDLKRILTGLAYQDAGDFLSTSEKIKFLGKDSGNSAKVASTAAKTESKITETHKIEAATTTKHIAFISNGSGLDAPLDYAIDTCLRQNAHIDLLIHGDTALKNITALENKIKQAGLACRKMRFKNSTIDNIVEYISQHPSLIFMISMPDDAVTRVLIEEILPQQKSGIQIPLVLIDDPLSATRNQQRSAA